MGFFSNFVGTQEFKHASFAKEELGIPKTAASTSIDANQTRRRMPRDKIEEYLLTDAQTLNQIDIYSVIPLQSGYKIKSEKKGSQGQYDEFFKNIGQYGMQLGEKDLIGRMLHDAALYGYSYIEKVLDRTGRRILDLKPIDAKLMDYARTNDGVIVTDEYQRPIGFTMIVGYSGYGARGGDPVPQGVDVGSDKIFLKRERIACFLFRPFGNGFESIGVVETAALDIDRKIHLKKAIANSIHNSAAYPVIGIVGDAQRSASKQLRDATLEALQNMSTNRYSVFSHPTKIETLKVEHSPHADEHLRFLRSEQSTAAGIALGISVGSGEAVNRQTLTQQQELLDMRFDGWLERFQQQFNKQILDALYEKNGYSSKAELFWNDVSLDDKIDKAQILLASLEKDVISPQEVRNYILSAYDIQGDEEEYQKYLKEKEERLNAIENMENAQADKNKAMVNKDKKDTPKDNSKGSKQTN